LVFVEKVYYITTLEGHDIFEIANEFDTMGYRLGKIVFIPFRNDISTI
jgi:hypothetical protein